MATDSIPKRGVYAIECTDGRFYVGGSINIPKRWVAHRSSLRKGDHKNSALQAAWNVLGADAFTFAALEAVPTGDILAAEQRHIDRLGAFSMGFNLYPTAGSPAGYVASAETRAKVGAAGRGRVLASETRAKISTGLTRFFESPEARAVRAIGVTGERNGCAKLSAAEVLTIRSMAAEGVTQRIIGERFGVGQQAISKVLSGARWASVS